MNIHTPSLSSQAVPQGVSADTVAMMRFESMKKSQGVAYLLWLFLGGFGAHRFYLRSYLPATVMLLLALVSIPLSFFGIGLIGVAILVVWCVVDAFLIPRLVRRHNVGLIDKVAPGQPQLAA